MKGTYTSQGKAPISNSDRSVVHLILICRTKFPSMKAEQKVVRVSAADSKEGLKADLAGTVCAGEHMYGDS